MSREDSANHLLCGTYTFSSVCSFALTLSHPIATVIARPAPSGATLPLSAPCPALHVRLFGLICHPRDHTNSSLHVCSFADKEQLIKQYIQEFVSEHPELSYVEDAAGNVLVRFPGSGARAGKLEDSIILQGHIDMVTEKEAGSDHCFDTDPLTLKYDGARWLTATATTLGADNGVGVCAALALLEAGCAGLELPPLEILCTVAEEVGLVGAFNIDVNALGIQGALLINVDSEDFPHLYVGCAGGGDSLLSFRAIMEEDASVPRNVWKLSVSGLPGGHSGLDIHRNIANAVIVCANFAAGLLLDPRVRLVSIEGGDKRNALARDATVTVDAPADVDLVTVVEELKTNITGHGARVELLSIGPNDRARAIRRSDAQSILDLLLGLPHGPLGLEADGVSVQTSSNLASIKVDLGGDAAAGSDDDHERFVVQCSTRSSVDADLEKVRSRIRELGEQLGWVVTQNEAYPGWQDAGESPLRALALEALPAGAEVRTIHAGLEAGVLKKKIEAANGRPVDAIAVGPTIVGAHSPEEACDVASTREFYAALEMLVARLGS